MTLDIFLSGKREDKKLAARLAKALEAQGFSVWWDRSLIPADSWRTQIQAALDAAAVTVVIWTQERTGPLGDFVRDETGQGAWAASARYHGEDAPAARLRRTAGGRPGRLEGHGT